MSETFDFDLRGFIFKNLSILMDLKGEVYAFFNQHDPFKQQSWLLKSKYCSYA
jgi:hypothetical protein